MNEIEKLIQELCPDGVEYRRLGEVACYAKNRIDSCNLNFNNYVSVENLLKDKKGKKDAENIPSGQLIRFQEGDILIGNIRPYLKKIWMANCQGGTNGDVLCIRIFHKKIIIPKYLYYVLSSNSFFDYDDSHAKGGKMPRGDKQAVLSYPIPLPPITIQEKIVEILDKFTSLEAELEAELEARKSQYEYYRNKLLDFNGEM